MARRKRREKGTKCYACTAPATTWEHAPPKAFYPKRSELGPNPGAVNYRRDLIVVPSCEAHNNAKSKDDNYALAVIATLTAALKIPSAGRGPTIPFFEKLGRAFFSGRRLKETAESFRELDVLDGRGESQGVMTLDAKSIDATIEAAARALYYHHRGWKRRWPAGCKVRNLHTVMPSLALAPDARALGEIEGAFVELERRGHEYGRRHGPHPEIFFYQLISPHEGGKIVMRLCFYQYFTFIAVGSEARTLANVG